MPRLRSVLHGIDVLSEWSGKAASVLILFMIGSLVYYIILRGIFNLAIQWIPETAQFIYGGISILAGAYILRYRGHINMDILYNRFSPRKKAYIDLFTSLLFFLFCGLMLWYGVGFAWRSLQILERTTSTWEPLYWPAKMMIPIGAFLILLQGLAKFTRDVITATGREL